MALNWNISNVANSDTVCFVGEGNDRRLSVTTETLIFSMMAIGMMMITEKNAVTVATRLAFYEALNGGLRRGADGVDVRFTLEEVRAHIGLTTNVSNETDAQWRKRITDAWFMSATYNARHPRA